MTLTSRSTEIRKSRAEPFHAWIAKGNDSVAHLLSVIETFLMMRPQLDDLGDRSESENAR